jgi:4-amino-4-deoxy-L-arabinose transferase-like glycosyltransferase
MTRQPDSGAFDGRGSRTEPGNVTTEPAEVTASATQPPGFRIRWGWFLGCIASGVVAIAVGWLLAAPAGRTNYLPGVLANVGTTLLFVGIVVLLERRIVDNAVRKFRNAAEEARARIRDDFRIEVQNFTDRVNAEWAAASPEDVDAMKERTKRLSKELADNYVDETLKVYDVDETQGR